MAASRKILVVESEPRTSLELSASLRQYGWEVVLATDAVAVLTMALRHRPNAVVLGARIDVGGAQLALRRLRSSVHTAGIPVVALAEPGRDKQALLSAGTEECLDLPSSAEQIIAALESCLNVDRRVSGAPAAVLGEPRRLAALAKTGMLDTEPDEELDLLTRLAARLLRAPVVLVSLVDGRRQFFKSQIGLPEPWDVQRQTPLSHSFCQWVVSSDQELSVNDARIHPILRENQAIKDLGVVAYAGVPLSAITGEAIGSFCAIDGKPREWTDDDLVTLRDLGTIVDAHSALGRVRASSHGTDPGGALLQSATLLAAKGFVGAARLLNRHGGGAEERATLAGIIERHGHQLVAAADTSISPRAAA